MSSFRRGRVQSMLPSRSSNPSVNIQQNRKKGKWIFSYETELGFSLPNGDSVTLEESTNVQLHTKLFLSFWLDSDINLKIEWKSKSTDEWVQAAEDIPVPASVDAYGRTHTVPVVGSYYRITLTTTGASPLTYVKVSLYGNKG